MKKVLLASTALVAFAGVATAQVSGSGPGSITLSGEAEMGVAGRHEELDFGGAVATTEYHRDTQFFQSADVTFSMAGETDGGIGFGVAIELGDIPDDNDDPWGDGDYAIFITGVFGTVTMGDTDGALDFVMDEANTAGSPGSIDDAETSHEGYLGSYLDGVGGGRDQIVRYDYTFNQFQFAVSVAQESGGNDIVEKDEKGITWAVGFGYQFEFAGGTVDLGIGHQVVQNIPGGITLAQGAGGLGAINVGSVAVGNEPDISATGVSAALVLDSGFEATVTYTSFNFDNDDDMRHVSVGLGYSFDALSLHLNYGQFDGTARDGTDDFTASGFGLAAGYDLGGGASILFGYGSSTTDYDFNNDGNGDTFTQSQYSLGLSFAF